MRRVSTELPYFDQMREGLKTHFGLDAFRPGQAEVISSVLSGKNTVAVMPTGAGKSLCYQLPAMLLDGVTVVVSPLIALMHDQVDQLTARGIPAAFINSTLSDSERLERQRKLRGGEYKLIYVAPERFRSEAFTQALLEANVALYAIDEAHCISQWGHDFRPEYAQLGQVRKRLRPPRTVALTATATPEVRDDITRVLLMKEPCVWVAGFDRPNLFLDVVPVSGDADKRHACEGLVTSGSGVIYCATRKQAEAMHAHLEGRGTRVVLYHAGLDDNARRQAQDTFMGAPGCVAVATNAFGMGIDKADLRFVAHAAMPRAVEAYYQEIGRAGRDGQPAHAVLLFNHADVFTQERLIQSNHPPDSLFGDVWNIVRGGAWERGVNLLAAQVGASEFEVSAVLKLLERERLLSRGHRGEGRYGLTLLPGAASQKPRSAAAQALLRALAARLEPNARASLEVAELSRDSGLDDEAVRHALSLLERAGALQVVRPFGGRAIVALRLESWSDLGIDLGRWRAQERNQLLLLKRMTDFCYTRRCRRAYLLRYFGEEVEFGASCGHCDVCVGSRVTLTRREKLSSDRTPRVSPLGPECFSALAAEELKRWRRELSQDLAVPPFIVFNDATLYALAAALPTTKEDFMRVKGTGEARWERFGPRIVQICLMARAAGDAPQPVAAGRRQSRASAS